MCAPVAQLVALPRGVLLGVLLRDLVVRPAVEDARLDLVQRLHVQSRDRITAWWGMIYDVLQAGLLCKPCHYMMPLCFVGGVMAMMAAGVPCNTLW